MLSLLSPFLSRVSTLYMHVCVYVYTCVSYPVPFRSSVPRSHPVLSTAALPLCTV